MLARAWAVVQLGLPVPARAVSTSSSTASIFILFLLYIFIPQSGRRGPAPYFYSTLFVSTSRAALRRGHETKVGDPSFWGRLEARAPCGAARVPTPHPRNVQPLAFWRASPSPSRRGRAALPFLSLGGAHPYHRFSKVGGQRGGVHTFCLPWIRSARKPRLAGCARAYPRAWILAGRVGASRLVCFA